MTTERRRGSGETPSPDVMRLLSLLLLAGAVALFLAQALHQLHLPGLYYDEALDLAPMLQVMHGETPPLLRGIGVWIGDRAYPLMLMDYMGSLNGYLTLPFMAALGSGVAAARLQPILFSALTIVLAYRLAYVWFGRAPALLTALLLAINPSFIWFSRQGISVTSVMTVFSLASLLVLQRRLETGDWGLQEHSKSLIPNLQSLCAGLLLGLGLWAKLIFLWWIVAVAVITLVWLLTAPARRGNTGASYAVEVRARGLFILRLLPMTALGFAIGAAPLIYYNLIDLLRQPFDVNNAYTLGLLLRALTQPTEYGVNNLDVLANLGKALADFDVFVDGSYFWYNGVPFSNVYAVPAFIISAAAGSALAFGRREWRKWLALLAVIGVTVFISSFTVSGLWATHLFILLPFPQMVVAVAAVWLCQWLRRVLAPRHAVSRLSGILRNVAPVLLCAALLALPVSREVWVSQQHHAKLAETGGSGRFSDAVYALAEHLDAQKIAAPIALDWGIEKTVRVLTADRVRPEEIFGFNPEPDETFMRRCRELLTDPEQHYIVLWDRFAVYNRREAFTRIAQEMGLQVTETFIAHERSGLPVYVMLQAK